MRLRKIIVVIGAVLALMSVYLTDISATGIAVSPAEIKISDVMRGGSVERVLTIFNTEANESTFSIYAVGDISEWVSFLMDDKVVSNVTIPGKSSVRVTVRFTVPSDVPTGEYNGKIYVQSTPSEATGGQAAVVIRMPVDVTLGVTGKQILSGVVKSITVSDTEVNYPLKIRVEFQNTGNVIAKPEISVSIFKNGTLIDAFKRSDASVKVDERKIIVVEWSTTGHEPGDYEANVTVSLGGEVLAAETLHFKLLPEGTLSRRGELVSMSYEGDAQVGKTLKIRGKFVNSGEIETKAKLVCEVYVDGDLTDVVKSDELLVPSSESRILTAYLHVERAGEYLIKGHVVYDGKTTDTKELSFVVTAANITKEEQNRKETEKTTKINGFCMLSAVIAALILTLIMRRKHSS